MGRSRPLAGLSVSKDRVCAGQQIAARIVSDVWRDRKGNVGESNREPRGTQSARADGRDWKNEPSMRGVDDNSAIADWFKETTRARPDFVFGTTKVLFFLSM